MEGAEATYRRPNTGVVNVRSREAVTAGAGPAVARPSKSNLSRVRSAGANLSPRGSKRSPPPGGPTRAGGNRERAIGPAAMPRRRSKGKAAATAGNGHATKAGAAASSPVGSPRRRQELDLREVARHAKGKNGKSMVKYTLAGLPSQPAYWNTLTTLYLAGNQLTWLPESVGTLTSLVELWVSDNRLTELPASIGNLQELNFIRANNNRLQRLPDAIGELRKLRRLHLGRNELLSLPDSICQLRELRELLLSSNQIVHLPESIGYLQQLVKLHVCKNKLWRLPDSVCLLQNLKSCKIEGNPNMPALGEGTAAAAAPAVKVILRQSYARLHRARWSPRCHNIFGVLCNRIIMIAIMSGNRIHWLPPLMWETIFSFFKGSDIGQLLALNHNDVQNRLHRRGHSF